MLVAGAQTHPIQRYPRSIKNEPQNNWPRGNVLPSNLFPREVTGVHQQWLRRQGDPGPLTRSCSIHSPSLFSFPVSGESVGQVRFLLGSSRARMVIRDPHLPSRRSPRSPRPSFCLFSFSRLPCCWFQVPPGTLSFDKNCTQLPGPVDTQGDYDHLTYDGPHDPRRGRGYARKDSGAGLKSRLAVTDASERKRNFGMAAAPDTSEDSTAIQGKRCRAADLHLAPVLDPGTVKEDAQRWGSEVKAHWDVNHASPVREGARRSLPGQQVCVVKLWARNSGRKTESRMGSWGEKLRKANVLRGGYSGYLMQSRRTPCLRLLWTFAGSSPGKWRKARRM